MSDEENLWFTDTKGSEPIQLGPDSGLRSGSAIGGASEEEEGSFICLPLIGRCYFLSPLSLSLSPLSRSLATTATAINLGGGEKTS